MAVVMDIVEYRLITYYHYRTTVYHIRRDAISLILLKFSPNDHAEDCEQNCINACMVFVDSVYFDKVFYAIGSDCVCSSEKARYGFAEKQLHQLA